MRAPGSRKGLLDENSKVDWARGRRALCAAIVAAAAVLAPPPDLTISQWADTNRMLSAEASAEQGKWDTDRAPYQREMMDVLTHPGVREAVYMLASQLGKTELELNVLGYFMDQDPAPILIVYPTLDMGKAYSKTRLAPMIRDCPALAGKVKEARSRDSGNTLMMKSFPGGHLIIAGSNSAASLSSYPIRVVLCDEIDRFAFSAGPEGDPVELAFQRTRNFWNSLKIVVGTPTIKGASAIAKRFALSDQRYRYVPCPHCQTEQILEWKQVVWEKAEDGRHKPETAAYACPHCGSLIDLDFEKHEMDRKGVWKKHNPDSEIPGFTLNALYSPWVTLQEVVKEFLKKKEMGAEGLKTFFNLFMAQTWDPQDHQAISTEGLMARRETWTAQVPWGVGYLTASVDTQDDRLEFKVKGWGRGHESWLIHKEVIPGSPGLADVWAKLDRLRLQGYRHASGRMMTIEAMAVDVGGHFTKQASEWAKARIPQRVFPIRGAALHPHPLIKKSGSKKGLRLWFIGTTTAKDEILLSRIKLEQAGPGYMHFPNTSNKDLYSEDWCDDAYFKQLATSEHIVRSKNGRTRRWDLVSPGVRNEGLDLEVYAWAIYTLLRIQPEEMEARLAKLEQPFVAPPPDAPEPAPKIPKEPEKPVVLRAPRRGGGSSSGWG